MDNFTSRTLATLIVASTQVLLGLAVPGADTTPGPTTNAPPVGSLPFAERVARSPRNRPAGTDSLALPHVAAANLLPGPVTVTADRLALRYPDMDRVVWQVVPRTGKHAEYLARREELLKQGRADDLLKWCIENKLPECAEFELRGILDRIGDFGKPEYQKYCRSWLKYAETRTVGYSFPLPAQGEWFVLKDATGHHRIKHGAAFAFDLVIRKNGKPYSGDGRQFEDHYAWGQPILAQADGVVLGGSDKTPDAPVGRSGGYDDANFLSVYYGAGIQGFYGHLRKGSILVKTGEQVKKGQPLAAVGNSGASGMPHLHFTMADMSAFSVRGVFSYELKKGTTWLPVHAAPLPEDATVRAWEPQPDSPDPDRR